MSEHNIEYHKNWAIFFTVALFLVIAAIVVGCVYAHKNFVISQKYKYEELVSCIQTDRPAADCRLIVFGSK